MSTVVDRLSVYRDRVRALASRREQFLVRLREERQALREATRQLAAAGDARDLTRAVAEKVQEQAHARIAGVVSRCLRAVFGSDAYEFRINFRQKRARTEAVLALVRGGLELEDPLNEAAGGAIDVAALGLRLAVLVLARPRRRKLLCFDEPLKNLHGAMNRKRAADLLLSLARDFGVQILMSTGMDWLKVGHVVELGGDS